MECYIQTGEFSHPYVDKEINDIHVKQKVDQLIQEQLNKMSNEEMSIPTPPEKETPIKDYHFEMKELNEESQYEDLYQQESLLQVLINRQTEFWNDEIKRLTDYIDATETQNSYIASDISQINQRRKKNQETFAQELEALKVNENDLIKKIATLKEAISHLQESE